jgi:hypothetical protein
MKTPNIPERSGRFRLAILGVVILFYFFATSVLRPPALAGGLRIDLNGQGMLAGVLADENEVLGSTGNNKSITSQNSGMDILRFYYDPGIPDPVLTIEFSVSVPGWVRIDICLPDGSLVETIYDEYAQVGILYVAEFKTSQSAPGEGLICLITTPLCNSIHRLP